MNGSSGDEACEADVVPGCDLSLDTQGVFAGGASDEVESDVLDGGEVGGGVVGSQAAFVVANDHVHDPVQAVLPAQWSRTMAPIWSAGRVSEVM